MVYPRKISISQKTLFLPHRVKTSQRCDEAATPSQNAHFWGGHVFFEYILEKWSYGNDFWHGSKTSLNGCSDEKIMFIGGLEIFLDDFEKKVLRSK